ncbi:MAG: serine hydrolase domain-containing protein [Acidimicrobiia bacterium]
MRIALVVLCLAIGGATIAACSDDGSGSSMSEPADDLDAALEALVEAEGGPPGVIVVVDQDDDVEVHAAGVAEVGESAPIDADDTVRIASTAKAFSGAAALSLVSTGDLSLDATIAEYVPQYADEWGEVTLAQLLQHTSGVPDFIANPAAQSAIGESPDVPLPPDELLDFVADEPLNFEPGSEYEYSNSDNIAVGLMVESATGREYEDVLTERVYEPLGLDATSLPEGPELPTPFAHGYDVSEGEPEDVSEIFAGGWAWASGGIISTPNDLNRFIRAYVGGELFDEAVREQQLDLLDGAESSPPGPGENSAGLAIFRYETSCGTVYGHTGNTVGYTQFFAASDDGNRSVTFTVTTQLRPDLGEVFDLLREAQELAVCAALEGGE